MIDGAEDSGVNVAFTRGLEFYNFAKFAAVNDGESNLQNTPDSMGVFDGRFSVIERRGVASPHNCQHFVQ